MIKLIILIAITITFPLSALSKQKLIWRWHEVETELYSPSFSSNGNELVLVRQKHTPDGHEAEDIPEIEKKKLAERITKDNRYADPEIVLLKLGEPTITTIDWGWSPIFAPNTDAIVYAHQTKPITGFRILAKTLEGNTIKSYRRDTKTTITLATPISGYLSDPLFSPDGKRIIYCLSGETNGAYGGNIGIAQISPDGTSEKSLYPITKDFDLNHLIGSVSFVGSRLLALRARPTSLGIYLPGTSVTELLEIGTEVKSLYSWAERKSGDRSPISYASSTKGEVIVFDNKWKLIEATQKTNLTKLPIAKFPSTISPNGRFIATGGNTGIDIQDVESQKVLTTITPEGAIQYLKWSPDSHRIALIVTKSKKDGNGAFVYDELLIYEF